MEDFPVLQVPQDPNWSENYALAGYDPGSRVGIFMHMGRWRKRRDFWRELVTVLLPDGTVIASRAIGNSRADERSPGGAFLRISIDEDQRAQTWSFIGGAVRRPVETLRDRLTGDGPMEPTEFALEFRSDLPVWSLGNDDSGFAGHGHIEQVGRLTGTVRFGNESWPIDTLANRDHTRGPRLTSALIRHVWFQVMIEDGRCILGYQAQTAGSAGNAFVECCVIEGGALHPAKLELSHQLPDENPMAHIHDSFDFTVRYANGVLNGRVVHFPTTMHHQFTYPWDTYLGAREIGSEQLRRMIEQGVIYTFDNGLNGYGHMERTVPGRLLNDFELL